MTRRRCKYWDRPYKAKFKTQLNEEREMFSQNTQGFLIAEPETRSGGEIRIMSPHK